ncbi:hypothetical protein FHH43_04110 [Clostridium perfringens]|nr:hypothetical protein [Clostridium perfringens]
MKKNAISLLLATCIIGSCLFSNHVSVLANENKDNIIRKVETKEIKLDYELNRNFNGSTDYVDVTEDLSKVKSLAEGTIAVKFKANSTNSWQTLFSMSDKNDPSSRVFVGITNTGRVRYEVRENGQLKLGFEWPHRVYNDGKWHGLVINIGGENGAELYVDGSKLYSTGNDINMSFFNGVNTPNSLNIGRILTSENQNGQWYLNGEISNIKVFDKALSYGECLFLSEVKEESKPEPEGEKEEMIRMLKGNEDLNVVFTGDSITHGPLHTKGYRSYSEHFSERIKGESINGTTKEDSMVFNTGVSSATTRNIINGFDTWVKLYNPDIVFIMIGMNDSSNQMVPLEEYKSNVRELVDRTRENGAIPVLQTSNTIRMPSNRESLPLYMEAIREISRDKNVTLIDHYKHWEELEKENPNLKNEFLSDSIHPNEKGHLEMVKLIFKELEIFEEDSYTCNLSYPIKVENDFGRRVDTTYYPNYKGIEEKESLISYKIDKKFNGDFIDKSEDLSKVSALEKGTIVSRFKVENNRNAQTILSLSDSKDDASNVTLAINNGSIHFSVRENGAFRSNITTSKGGYNDGMWHTVAVDVGDDGTKIYVDGELIHSESNKGFFNTISEANSFNVGRNLDNKESGEWFYYGDISYIDIYEDNLSQEELIKSTKENLNDNLEAMTNVINENEKGAWVFLGDDDTTGKGDTFGYKNYVEYIEERVRWELNGGSMTKREKFMINSGVENADSEYLMNSFDTLVSKYNPKATFIMVGGNEKITPEEFKENLTTIINKTREIGSIPVLQTPIKNEKNIENYIKVIRDIAKEEKVLLIDHYEYWEKLSENQQWLEESWLLDGNPNHRGHLEIAKKILKDLRIYNYNSLTCRFLLDTPGDTIFEEVKKQLDSLINEYKILSENAKEGYEVGEYMYGAKKLLDDALIKAEEYLNTGAVGKIKESIIEIQEVKEKFDSLKITELTGDLNDDGLLNIGDLSLVSMNFGKNSNFEGWNEIRVYDLNKDEVINELEIDFISYRILNN